MNALNREVYHPKLTQRVFSTHLYQVVILKIATVPEILVELAKKTNVIYIHNSTKIEDKEHF